MSDSTINPNDLNLIDPDLLPPQIRQLVVIIGLPSTLTLLDARGGTPFRIPVNPEETLLLEIIGDEAAACLCKEWGNRVLSLPKSDKIVKQLRNLAINNSRQSLSLTELAQQFDLSRRHVINLLKIKDENPSMDLFDSPPLDNKRHP